MKRYNKFLIMIGLVTASMTSCHLDEFPTSAISYQAGNDMFQSIDDVLKFENGLNTYFRSIFYGSLTQTGELMCDGFNATIDYGNNYGGVHRVDNSFTSSNYDSRDQWSGNYSAIKNYNIFIEQVAKFSSNDAEEMALANMADGEAHFYRAFSYMQLVRHFAKAYNSSSASSDLAVPLVLVYDQEEKPARATVKQVYDQIKADLDVAASKLASVPGEIGSLYPTIDAVNALYARYYIDIKDYNNAASYATRVINSDAGYALSTTVDDMIAEYRNDNGTEPIMQLAATLTENGSGTNSAYTLTSKDNKFGIQFKSYYLPSQKLIDLYKDEDVRFQTWFTNSMYPSVISGAAHINSYYTFIKYLGNPELTSNGVPNSRQHVKPLLIGEMYMIAAEAYLGAGNTDAAKAVLNELQEARGAEVTEATIEDIQNEWFRETVGEDLRMSCLKRWGVGYTARTPQPAALEAGVLMMGAAYGSRSVEANDHHWAWPVPVYELQINDNLVQNPGYE
ncbi:MAG: RagB/SusD family nutrient uptake outer membrane protein [Phocaeicola sp.]|nr:RagB/SusD family nutrient uptake outer membrane protein [Phocaeicola sp.]MBR1595155.1 RagB/SusD family nutrient uptake outer membrane protein [Phocaeicola sp.]MBR1720805.1 RagB/SusD family nutrient uptake outer membrane protein [Phocaeicola sp.]